MSEKIKVSLYVKVRGKDAYRERTPLELQQAVARALKRRHNDPVYDTLVCGRPIGKVRIHELPALEAEAMAAGNAFDVALIRLIRDEFAKTKH